MAGYKAVSALVLMVFIALPQQHLASRVSTKTTLNQETITTTDPAAFLQEMESVQPQEVTQLEPEPKTDFVCPDACQECCHETTVFSTKSWFKCVLKGSGAGMAEVAMLKNAGTMTEPKRKEVKDLRDSVKEWAGIYRQQVESQGYQCNSPVPRAGSSDQFRMSCQYKDTEKHATLQCSKQTKCCCNKKRDEKQVQCVDPKKHQWFAYENYRHSDEQRLQRLPEMVLDAVQKDESNTVHFVGDDLSSATIKRNWQPAFYSGIKRNRPQEETGQTYDNKEGTCGNGLALYNLDGSTIREAGANGLEHYANRPSGFRSMPAKHQGGCCLKVKTQLETVSFSNMPQEFLESIPQGVSTDKDNAMVPIDGLKKEQLGLKAETAEQMWTDFKTKIFGSKSVQLSFEVCDKWEQKRYCEKENELYVESFGPRLGVCFGDHSTGKSLEHAYGKASADNIVGDISAGWKALAVEAVKNVKCYEKRDRFGQTRIKEGSCPAGWTTNLGGGGAQTSCDCGGCGGFKCD